MKEASIEEILAEIPPEDIDDIMDWVFGPEHDLHVASEDKEDD